MFTLSNAISLLRGPLALLFLSTETSHRLIAIVCAMVTDSFDGYYARKYNATSQLGAVLDPLMDKFFVFFALAIFLQEQRLTTFQAVTLMCRDFSILLFGIYLALRGYWGEYQFRSIWTGKITTTLQFFVLLSLTVGWKLPTYVFPGFVVLGVLALGELYFIHKDVRAHNKLSG